MKKFLLVTAMVGFFGFNSFSATKNITGQVVYANIFGSKGFETANRGHVKIKVNELYFYVAPTDVCYEIYLSILITARTKGNTLFMYYNDADTKTIDGATCFAIQSIQM